MRRAIHVSEPITPRIVRGAFIGREICGTYCDVFASRQPATSSYPWADLPKLSRLAAARERATRAAVRAALDGSRLAHVVRELFSAEVEEFGLGPSEPAARMAESSRADVQFVHPSFSLRISVEPGLPSLLLTRLLGRPAQFLRSTPLSPELNGAWDAICEEICRRLAVGPALEIGQAPPFDAGLIAPFWVRVEGQTYRGSALTALHPGVVPPRSATRSRGLPVSLPLVFATASLERDELALLALGDVFVPAVWGATPAGGGTVFACAPTLERALQFGFKGGELTLVGGAALRFEEEVRMVENNDTSQDAVVDAPVLVRIEVGAITMSAGQWMDLAPGDVISTGNALAAPVVLRVSGQQVALGELVNLEGELGVRVTKLG